MEMAMGLSERKGSKRFRPDLFFLLYQRLPGKRSGAAPPLLAEPPAPDRARPGRPPGPSWPRQIQKWPSPPNSHPTPAAAFHHSPAEHSPATLQPPQSRATSPLRPPPSHASCRPPAAPRSHLRHRALLHAIELGPLARRTAGSLRVPRRREWRRRGRPRVASRSLRQRGHRCDALRRRRRRLARGRGRRGRRGRRRGRHGWRRGTRGRHWRAPALARGVVLPAEAHLEVARARVGSVVRWAGAQREDGFRVWFVKRWGFGVWFVKRWGFAKRTSSSFFSRSLRRRALFFAERW